MNTRIATHAQDHGASPLLKMAATALVALAATLGQAANAQPYGDGYMGGGHMGAGHHMAAGQGEGAAWGMGMGSGRHLEHMFDAVKATPEQRAQIKQITLAAQADLRAQREGGRALHEQAATLFTQPTVDANAAEALRQQMLARHDQASKRVLQMMLDVSRVLTPEQRKTLADHMAQRRSMMEQHRARRAAPAGKTTP